VPTDIFFSSFDPVDVPLFVCLETTIPLRMFEMISKNVSIASGSIDETNEEE